MTGRSLAFDIHAEPPRGGLPDPGVFSLPGWSGASLRTGSVTARRLSHLIGWEIGHTGAGTVSATSRPHRGWYGPTGTADLVIAPAATLEAACFGAASPGFDVRLVTFSHQRCRPVLANSGPLIIRARATHVGATPDPRRGERRGHPRPPRPLRLRFGPEGRAGPAATTGRRRGPIDVPDYRTPEPHARPAPRYAGFTPEVFVRRAGLDVYAERARGGRLADPDLLGGALHQYRVRSRWNSRRAVAVVHRPESRGLRRRGGHPPQSARPRAPR